MRSRLIGTTIVLALTGAFALTGCKEEGAAEKAGKKLDKAAEDVTEHVEEAGEDLEKAAEDLGKSFDTGG